MERNKVIIGIKDLGVAAFIKLSGFKLKEKRGKEFFFEILEEEQEEFKQKQIEYINSPFNDYDQCLMSLKKL